MHYITVVLYIAQVFQLPPERIWVSVYEKDDEAYALWRDEVRVPESRIVRMGAADNFWAAGATGLRPHPSGITLAFCTRTHAAAFLPSCTS